MADIKRGTIFVFINNNFNYGSTECTLERENHTCRVSAHCVL